MSKPEKPKDTRTLREREADGQLARREFLHRFGYSGLTLFTVGGTAKVAGATIKATLKEEKLPPSPYADDLSNLGSVLAGAGGLATMSGATAPMLGSGPLPSEDRRRLISLGLAAGFVTPAITEGVGTKLAEGFINAARQEGRRREPMKQPVQKSSWRAREEAPAESRERDQERTRNR